ncbi:phage virion morphogenesis protein [bacterium]|nr:MAG: phage virion morphogenesis protein [bacterium]
MAGAKISITYDASTAIAGLDYVAGRLDSDGRKLLLSHVGEYMLGSTRDRAETQRGPDGQRWAPLSPRYARRKAKRRPGLPILRYDGNMLGAWLAWQLIDDIAVDIGTGAKYGARQLFGGGGVPPRVWLGTSPADDEEIVHIARDHLVAGMPES